MFYKIEEDGNWVTGNKIYFPDGIVLSIDNKIEKDGWIWYDNPSQEYIEWLNIQEENN
jgi:hypothetical protein